ncbi:MAG: hypothetical protein QXP70_03775 [Methanomassiliicoccales archaeon]
MGTGDHIPVSPMIKCYKCGHDRAWHISASECIFPDEKCSCTGYEGTSGIDALSLFYFSLIGGIVIFTGSINLIFSFGEIHFVPVKIALSIFTIGVGTFIITYMNYRGQKIARELAAMIAEK